MDVTIQVPKTDTPSPGTRRWMADILVANPPKLLPDRLGVVCDFVVWREHVIDPEHNPSIKVNHHFRIILAAHDPFGVGRGQIGGYDVSNHGRLDQPLEAHRVAPEEDTFWIRPHTITLTEGAKALLREVGDQAAKVLKEFIAEQDKPIKLTIVRG